MTALLTDNLPLLSGAPNGIKKLRELILELAVRGKLVPQDPNDEPASELLKRIAKEKARLVADGKIKKQKPIATIAEEEKPYDLPDSWAWVKLPEIYYSVSVSGNKLMSSQISEEGVFPVVDQGKKFVAGYTDDESLLIRLPGPVVVFGDHTTERKYVDFDFVAGADGVKILRPVLLDEKFFWWHLVGLKLEGRGYARHFKVLNDAFFALPPKGEQSRIVAKVDELMALCDRLEAQQADAESAHAQLVQALLDSLTQASDATDFATNWQRLAEHFHTLFTTESSIDALKQTLLQLAVMGKLVPQDSGDEPASELLKRIAEDKARLVAEGKLKKHKPLAESVDEEHPFSIPPTWVWVKPEEFSMKITDGEHFKPPTEEKGVYFLSAKDIRDDGISLDNPLFISEQTAKKALQRCDPKYGDLLIVSRGATVGRMCKVNVHERFCLLGSVILIKPAEHVLSEFLSIALKSPDSFRQLTNASGSTAQPAIYLRDLKKIAIPLPPLAEQHRIVTKVDQLMTLCDQLKTRLTQARQLNGQLADVLVAQATS